MRSFRANPHHSSARSSTTLAMIFLALAAAACNSDPAAPGAHPLITGNTPLDGAAAVALDVKPTATFDREIRRAHV